MKAQLYLDTSYRLAKVDKRMFGAFIEHLAQDLYRHIRADHPLADQHGFRRDVAELVRELDVPVIRYPGGNFVFAYNWEDGVGPVERDRLS